MFQSQHRLARTTTGIAGLALLALCLVAGPARPDRIPGPPLLASTRPTVPWRVSAPSTSSVTTSPATACLHPRGSLSADDDLGAYLTGTHPLRLIGKAPF